MPPSGKILGPLGKILASTSMCIMFSFLVIEILYLPNVLNALHSFVVKKSCYALNGYLKSPKRIKIAPKMMKMALYQL
jgi:hypothetical protein